MRVQIACLCRGSEKVYVLLQVEGLSDCAAVRFAAHATASEREGDEALAIPSMLYPLCNDDAEVLPKEGGLYLAVLPDVQVGSVALQLIAIDAGRAQGKSELSYTPSSAKWKSRRAYRLQRALCAYIRDYDTKHAEPTPLFRPIDFIEGSEGGEDTVLFAVPSACERGKTRLKIFDKQLHVEDAPLVMVRETSECCREAVFSARVPKSEDIWYLEVSSEGPSEDSRFVLWTREQCEALHGQTATADSEAGIVIRPTDCIDDLTTAEDVLRVSLMSIYEHDDLRLDVFDTRMVPYGGTPIVMKSASLPSVRETGCFCQETVFSVRMGKPAGALYLEASSEGHPEINGFIVWRRGQHEALRMQTNRHMLDAMRDPGYPLWFEAHKATKPILRKQANTKFDYMPLFSIVVPLYKTPVALFNEMLDSVLAQSYTRWELLLVNASPEATELCVAVQHACELDKRVKAIALEGNRGISENTNAGLAQATGDFVCFFDHDDLLEPNALFEYARAINEHPDADVLYCDEDKLRGGSLGAGGYLCEPYFKPCFSPDLLCCNNYICHLMAIRKSLLDEIPPNTKEFDGAQDHNLVLQATERARCVHHIPRVLYHWRAIPGSTADTSSNKPDATAATMRSVQVHLDRLGVKGTVVPGDIPFTCKIRYEMPAQPPLVSIIIPTKNCVDVLRTCVESIFEKSTYPNYEVILIDNGSTDDAVFSYYRELEDAPGKRVRVASFPEFFSHSAMNNLGASLAKGEYLILLNNDTEVITEGWIEGMLGPCMRPEVGAVGVRLYYRDGTTQHAGVFFAHNEPNHSFVNIPRGMGGYFNLAACTQNVSAVTAACLMVSHADYDAVGGLSEAFPADYNDVDFCFKLAEKGRLIVYEPGVELYHYESLSRGTGRSPSQRVQAHVWLAEMNEKWAEKFEQGDPYLNPNFGTELAAYQYRRL